MTNIKKTFKIGMSSAASWAWGTSLIMGQQIAQEKGAIAFWIWATVNALTLAVFGYLHNKKIIKPEIYRSKFVKIIALVIQLFCLLVQLNFIDSIFMKLTNNSVLSYAVTFVIGAAFVLAMFKKGLKASIFTDIFQWAIALASIVIILGVGVFTHAPTIQFVTSTGSDITWGIWSALILLAGPIGDVQHWQRAEYDDTKKGYYLGAVFFFVYMLLIFGMANFEFSFAMNVILLITVLCVTTSTIDSIAVATHEMGGKKIGTAVCLLICAFWGVLAHIGMVSLWSSFGVIRVVLAVAIIILPLFDSKKYKITVPAMFALIAALVAFPIMKSVDLTNIFGILCEGAATVIIIYLFASMIKGTSKLFITK